MIKFLVNQLPNLPLIGLDVVSQAVTPLRPTLCTTPETLGWTSNRYHVAYLLVVRPRLTQRVVCDNSAGGEISERKGENIEDWCDVCIPLVVRILYPGGHALPAVDGEGELLGPYVLPELGPGGHQLGPGLVGEVEPLLERGDGLVQARDLAGQGPVGLVRALLQVGSSDSLLYPSLGQLQHSHISK